MWRYDYFWVFFRNLHRPCHTDLLSRGSYLCWKAAAKSSVVSFIFSLFLLPAISILLSAAFFLYSCCQLSPFCCQPPSFSAPAASCLHFVVSCLLSLLMLPVVCCQLPHPLPLLPAVSILFSAAFFLGPFIELSDISCTLPLILLPVACCQLPHPLPLLPAVSILLSAAFFLGPFSELSEISCILPPILSCFQLSAVSCLILCPCCQLPVFYTPAANCLHSVVG